MEQTSEKTECSDESPFKFSPIGSLSNDLLSKIFSYLEPNDRFRLAEVCTHWSDVSQIVWSNIISLDLSLIPAENIGPIIRLCSKLQSITAQDCELDVIPVIYNLRCELKSLHLYRVSAHTGLLQSHYGNAFLRELQQPTHLEELVLSELPVASLAEFDRFVWSNLSGSLRRLQLNTGVFWFQSGMLQAVRQPFATLDCLILQEDSLPPLCALIGEEVGNVAGRAMIELFNLQQLRELSLDPRLSTMMVSHAAGRVVHYLRLEILSIQISNANALSRLAPLLNSHPTLRVLIITGAIAEDADEILIPPRRRYPKGFGSDPLPLLHVFIGGQIAQKIRFSRTPNDVLEIHPITQPMPQFLEQPQVAAIFKGSWIAEMIKKGVKANSRLWDYDARTAQSVLVLNP